MENLVLLKIEEILIIDEKIERLLNKIHQVEVDNNIVEADGYFVTPKEYLKKLFQELKDLDTRRIKIEEFLNNLEESSLMEAYEYLAELPKDNLKIAKLCYLFNLMNNIYSKGKER